MSSITDPRRQETIAYMNISASHRAPEKCVEEIRVEDYLKAYSTTGQPPPPCPPEPASEKERLALGLPLLFQPYIEDAPPGDLAAASLHPASVPQLHIFRPVRLDTGELSHNISMQPDYNKFAPEELRCQAYLTNNIYPSSVSHPLPDLPPISISSTATRYAIANQPPTPAPASTSPYFSNDNTGTAFNSQPGPSGAEYFLSISSSVKYAKHSLEELRISFLQTGQELTSADIQQSQSKPRPATALLSGGSAFSGSGSSSLFGGSGSFSPSPAVRQF